MRVTITTIVLVIMIASAIFVFLKNKERKHIHYHAGFTVYIDGQKQDYSDPQFMYFDVCTVEKNIRNNKTTQADAVHLHDGNGDVAHIHEEGATWGLLLHNIGVKLPKHETVTGFMSGSSVENILSRPIDPYDSVLIVVGSAQGIDLETYVTKKRILEVEGKSNYCNK